MAAKCAVALSTFDSTDTSGDPVTSAWCQSNRDSLIAATKALYVSTSTKSDVDACVSELANVDCANVCGMNYSPPVCNKVMPDSDSTTTQCGGQGSGGSGGSGGVSGGSGGSDPTGGTGGTGMTCEDSCEYANDGECDEPDFCDVGTDCTDCG